MPTQSKKEQGLGAIVIVLIILLVGALGFIGWRVYDALQPVNVASSTPKEQASDLPLPANQDTNYFELKDWAVRFKLATENLHITAYKSTETFGAETVEMYSLTTTEVEAFGGLCAHASADFMPLVTVSRTKNKAESGAGTPEPIMIGDYYYYVTGAQSTCSGGADLQGATEATAHNQIEQSLTTLEAVQ